MYYWIILIYRVLAMRNNNCFSLINVKRKTSSSETFFKEHDAGC